MIYKNNILIIAIFIYGSTCSVVVDTHAQNALNVSDYCPKIGECGGGSHVMCLYNSARVFGPTCWDFLTNITITPDYAHLILGITNKIRSKVANGKVKAANGEPFPKGYGIFRVEWDEELATFAQVWANQCILRQDLCRSSKKFPHVSQALGIIRLTLDDWMPIHHQHHINDTVETWLTPAKVKNGIKVVLKAWWGMKNSITPNNVKMFNESAAVAKNNKFLNLIFGPLTHIGCGISVYKEYAYKHNKADLIFNCIQVVCNFSARPKLGKPIYTVDAPKKPGYTIRCGCPLGYDEDEDCLCYETGRKIPYSCKDNDQCKPAVVVLPIFTVEDATTPGTGNESFALRETSIDSLDRLGTSNKRIPLNNYNDIFTNLDAEDYKSDLNGRFPIDVKSRYFNKHSNNMALVHNTTKSPYRLAVIANTKMPIIRQKPSIFTRARRFELPIKKRNQTAVNLVHQPDQFKKDVAPRKDFTKVQKLLSRYLDKKRHRKPYEEGFDSGGYMSHGPVTHSHFNNTINQKFNENDIKKYANPKINYTNKYNDELKQQNINRPDEGDINLMILLDKLEEEVKNIDLNTNEKEMFDQKIRKIYETLVGKSDMVDQKFKLLSKDSTNETLTGDINFKKFSEIDHMNVDEYGLNLNKPKHNYRDFEDYRSITNYENKLERAYGNKFFDHEAKEFLDGDSRSIFQGVNNNVQKRKFRNTHELRENYNNHENRYSRINDDEYYPLSNERRKYYYQKLANLRKKIKNMKRNRIGSEDLPKEVHEDRHIRPVRPTKQENQQRRRRPNDHVNSYYMPDRARYLHGF